MKRLFLITPRFFGYEKRIKAAAEDLGFHVTYADERMGNGFWTKSISRLGVTHFLKSKRSEHVSRLVESAKAGGFSHILVCAPETLKGDDLERIKNASPAASLIVYSWDSKTQKPLDDQIFSVADIVYSFDPVDCDLDDRLTHVPLFHCHNLVPDPAPEDGPDFVFVGTAHLRRIKLLAKLEETLRAKNHSYLFYLKSQSVVHFFLHFTICTARRYKSLLSLKALPYEEYLNVVARAKGVVDIEYETQAGLTMRSLEVVFSNRRLLTTNQNIVSYDFYDPGCISVIQAASMSLPDQMYKYRPPSKDLFEKYHISNWLDVILSQSQLDYLKDSITK